MKPLALALCILGAVLAAGSCTVSDPEEKQLISILVPDSLKSYDGTRILLLDPSTRDTLDTLWSAPFADPAQLSGLEPKRYAGGPVEVVIEGWRSGELALVILARYQADGTKPKTETLFIKAMAPETIPDTVKPDLALTGPDSMKLEQGRPYADAGAHCRDDRNGDLPVAVTGAVDEAVVGIHTLRFDCADSAGNKAPPATRKVHVVRAPDTLAPVITLMGRDTAESDEGREYRDPGAACLDERDGNLPVTVAGDSVDAAVRGEYRRSYACSDSAGNAGREKIRIVRIVRLADSAEPILVLRGRDSLETWQGIPYSDSGAVCEDERDGNLPVTVEGSVDVRVRGAQSLKYRCADSAGNAAREKIRRVVVIRVPDTLPPALAVKGPDTAIAIENRPYSDSGAACRDDRDGDLPVTVTGAVDILARGAYPLVFGCADSAGNAAAARTRIVKVTRLPDAVKPLLFLRGPDSLIVYDREPYADSGAVCMDDRDGPVPVIVQGSVDTGRRARHILAFQCADSAGNQAVERRRVVKVERRPDAVRPVLKLRESDSLDAHQGLPYQDAGSDCTDDRDGTIAPTVTGSVDTATRGLYSLAFHCADSAGNAADAIRKVRVVRVPDTSKPVITLRGSARIRIPVGEAYADSGADCADARDGALPVKVSGAVGPAKADYLIRYDCADSAGNEADSITRTVSVIPRPDSAPPAVTLAGEDTIPLVSLASFSDPGGACHDAEDGPLTLLRTGITPPGTAPGFYRVGYSCRDSAGNEAMAARTLKVGLFGTYLGSIADAQIDTLVEERNFGATGGVCMVVEPNGNYFTLIRFDLSKVAQSGLKAAKLRLFSFGHGSPWPGTHADYTFQVYRVKSDWVEGTGNWFYHNGALQNGGESWLEHYPMSAQARENSTDPTVQSGIMGSDKHLVREKNLALVSTRKLNLFFSDRNGNPNQVPPPDHLTVVELDVTEHIRSADPAADYGFVVKVFGVPAGRYMDFTTRDLGDGSWAPRLMLEY